MNTVERGSFAPLVFATSGGMGKQATVFLQMPCLPARIEEGPAL